MNVRDEFTVDVYFGEERRNSYRFRREKAPKGREQFVETGGKPGWRWSVSRLRTRSCSGRWKGFYPAYPSKRGSAAGLNAAAPPFCLSVL